MDGTPATASEALGLAVAEAERLAAIAEFYDHATVDYRYWSAGLHMHFGCWRWPLSPFDRAGMVERLSLDVLDRLGLPEPEPDRSGPVLDLGCGVGTTARLLARRRPGVQVLGASLSADQVAHGNRISAELGLRERVELRVGDYRAIPCASGSASGAYAIESACYDPDHGAGLIREAARVLVPGARLVVADAFRRRPTLSSLAAGVERRMLAGWRLPQLSEVERFTAHLRAEGYVDIDVEDISWRVGPSAVQVPLVALDFCVRAGLAGGRQLHASRRGNASASVWGLVYALLFPRCLGYFLITATRR
jgi:SAM-dependent methyltransferase